MTHMPRLHPDDLAALRAGIADDLIAAMRELNDAPGISGYLTVDETAALLGVHRSTLKRRELSGELVPARLGSIVRYRKRDVDALAEKSAA